MPSWPPPCPSTRASRRAIDRSVQTSLTVPQPDTRSCLGRARRVVAAIGGHGLTLGLLAVAVPTAAQSIGARAPVPSQADFHGEVASQDVRKVAQWIVAAGDNHGLPFIIIDKIGAKVFVFDTRGVLAGAAPALLGLGRGDDSVPGIGHRRLATITPAERTTPTGRFTASIGNDFEQDVLWVDYDAALSLHRVIVGKPADRRHARLASPTVLDNRISYGCINVPAQFYDTVVARAFKDTVGIVYILPETRPIEAVFALKKPVAATATRTVKPGDATVLTR